MGKTIGEGTFGKVKIGLHVLTKTKVAVKSTKKPGSSTRPVFKGLGEPGEIRLDTLIDSQR